MASDKDREEARGIIENCHGRYNDIKKVASEIARIRAEAKAEALREAAERADKEVIGWLAGCQRRALRAAILADESPKRGLKETIDSIRERWGKDFDTADEPNPKCTWDFDGDLWASECGISWQFPEYGPKENDVNFCPKCGKPVCIADDPNKEE